jgi:N-acetyl-anhydromuramyl-L-alanine amidase AmpD
MAKHRTRIGLHARNSVHFTEADYELVRRAGIETMKMMSQTDISVYQRLRRQNPDIEFVVRLYDDRLRHDSRPSPADFVAKMVPIINQLKPYVTKFEIHNEPNHVDGIEAWGASDQHARSFRDWYMQVLPALKQQCPWASFGFPGLALNYPHRDLEWLDICRNAIVASDWLGCHCYWQYGNMMKDEWGLRFKLYHERFPGKTIEITEFGDSTPNRPRDEIAQQYVRYYQELNKYPYLGSASAFIASSPDPTWVLFVWMKEGGEMLPVVRAVGEIKRTPVETEPFKPEPLPEPVPEPVPTPPTTAERTFPQTGKTVRGNFLEFFENYGLDICGYPITDQITEAGLFAQYFQRVGLEETKKGEIRLKLVGTEAWTSREKIAQLETRLEDLSQQPPPAGGLGKPSIQDIVDELPSHASERYPTRARAEITQIVIHHTATSPTITPERLAEYQVRKLNKARITYHYVITADGAIYQTNKLETVSDHAFHRNQESVGICFTGNFTSVIPTTAQLTAGGQLCAWLLVELRLSQDKIVGLGEFVNTQSPGQQWLKGQRWKDKLLAEVQANLETVGEDQSTLIASLREQIEALEAEIERLELEGPAAPGLPTSNVQDVLDQLTTVTAALQKQTQALQQENAKLVAALKEGDEEQANLVASLRAQVQALEKEKDTLLAKLAAALKEQGDDQSALITSLRAQISSLQKEIARLKQQPPSQPPSPVLPPSAAGVSQPAIQVMVDKLPKHATDKYKKRSRSDIKTLVIHHSAVAPSVGPKRIAEYHVKNLNWPGIGYHFLVAEDGIIYQGNEVTTTSYHAAKVNPRGVGICFLGNFNKNVPPEAQLQAGAHLVAWLLQELDLDLETVKGHQEFMGTACPGNQWLKGKKWKQMLRREVAKVQAGEALVGQPTTPAPGTKLFYHYLLFWHHGDQWATQDWLSAQDYIGAFQPTVGFSATDAVQAEYVTIVGGPLGVSQEVENWLVAQGSKVDRIAGANEAATKRMLGNLVKTGKRFRSFDV